MNSQDRANRTDLGLELMRLVAVPGRRYTVEEIAAYADCSVNNIKRLEQRALQKLARALKKAKLDKTELEK